jgi:hypothetical protein
LPLYLPLCLKRSEAPRTWPMTIDQSQTRVSLLDQLLVVLGAEDVHLERLPGGADVVAVGAGEAGREHVARLHVLAHHGLVD